MLTLNDFSAYEPEPNKISTGFKVECFDDETFKTFNRVVWFEPSSCRYFIHQDKTRMYLGDAYTTKLKAFMQQIVR